MTAFAVKNLACLDCTTVKFDNENNPVGVYFFKINNGNTRAMKEIYSNLTIKTREQCHWRRLELFIVNSEEISHFGMVFPSLTFHE